MRRILILVGVSWAANVCVAQIADNFSDGDFVNNPTWAGTAADFIVNASQQLQLNNSIAATSYLTTPVSTDLTTADAEWQLYVKQGFAPSGSNYGRIYLMSDQADLTQPLNGYYVQLGEAGAADAPELFRQTGTSRISVCHAATSGSIAASFSIRLKITRSSSGQWQLLADYTGGTSFSLEATATDATHTAFGFSGMMCVYTVSNSTKFYFDDFSLTTTPIPDTTPPELTEVAVIDRTTLNLLFSEPLETSSATLPSNYSVNPEIGTAASASLQPGNKTVRVSFSSEFRNGHQHRASVTGVKDVAGNTMEAVDRDFLFFQAVPAKNKSIVITEILPDPSPQVGLPDAEFIEIFNRSPDPFDLNGWKLSDGSSVATLPAQILLPQEYRVFTSSGNAGKFSSNLPVTGLSNFPTLNNDGDALTLKDPGGLLVDSVNYTLNWYRNIDKQEGGWSLEIIDMENICGEETNWTAAENVNGGTPGTSNSVKASKPDLTGPRLLSVVPVKSNQLLLTFDEKLAQSPAATFTLSPEQTITHSGFRDRSLREIILDLGADLVNRQLYSVRVSNLYDCAGNSIQENHNSQNFALPEAADSLDVVINEILFNPRSGGVDFVEIFNISPKYINLKGWKVSNFENGSVKNSEIITSTDFLLAPGGYLALTPDPVILKNHYPNADESNFFKCDLPGMSDDEGSVALVSDANELIDQFFYDHSMHSALIQDEEGVSLERISVFQPTNDPANWKSATSVSGFATPGAINSNTRPETAVAAGSVVIDPEVFSPGSGVSDFTKINYSFEQASCIANVKVYDQQGHLVKTIANNQTLDSAGFLRWEGDRDDGSKARMGYYVVWFEVLDLSGSIQTYRKRVAVAARD